MLFGDLYLGELTQRQQFWSWTLNFVASFSKLNHDYSLAKAARTTRSMTARSMVICGMNDFIVINFKLCH